MIFDDTRADWNARPPLRALTAVPSSARIGVSWHWIGPGYGPRGTGPHSACLAQVRDWQYQHQHKPAPDGPWKDIGYNALICQHARAIEGRGLGYSGSHSPSLNTAHWGIQFMVGDTAPPPTPAMYARARRLRADLQAMAGHALRDWPHRKDPKTSTECPGDTIAAWATSGGPTTQEDDMPTMDEMKAVFLTKADGAQLRKDIGYARDQVLTATDPARLAGALAANLPGTATQDDLEAALRKVLGSVDEVAP